MREAILQVVQDKGPTSREQIAAHLGVASKELKCHIDSMKQEGLLEMSGDRRGAKYTIRVTNQVKPLSSKPRLDINKRFEMMLILVKAVVTGGNNSLIVTGRSGTGKTSTILEALTGQGLEARYLGQTVEPHKHFLHVKGANSATDLYRIFFEHSEALIVFDDCDSVFNDGNGMNVLKAVLDTFKERTVSWVSNYVQKSMGLPESYTFKGKVIFVTNQTRINPALMSRGLNVDLNMTHEELCERMNLLGRGMNEELTESEHEELILFLREHATEFTDFSLRTYVKIAELIASGVSDWRDLALWAN